MIEEKKPSASQPDLEEHTDSMKKLIEKIHARPEEDGLTQRQRMAFALCGMYRLKDGSWKTRGDK